MKDKLTSQVKEKFLLILFHTKFLCIGALFIGYKFPITSYEKF